MASEQDRIQSLERTVSRLQWMLGGAVGMVVLGVLMGQVQIQQPLPPPQAVMSYPRYVATSVPPSVDGKMPGYAVVCDGLKERVIMVRDDNRPAVIMDMRYRELQNPVR